MHSFLRSVGFSKIQNMRDTEDLVQYVLDQPDTGSTDMLSDGRCLREYRKNFGCGMQIAVVGEEDVYGVFRLQYMYPLFNGSAFGRIRSTSETVSFEKNLSNDSYYAACDDVRIGTTLIFFLRNTRDCLQKINEGYFEEDRKYFINLSGLAEKGTILLPLEDNGNIEEDPESEQQHMEMIRAAQNGDAEAMESLTIEEFDTYSMLIDRIEREDIYTIVNSFFMPKGIANDRYSVMGVIEKCCGMKNIFTGEETQFLRVRCNGIPVDICINRRDLMGEPAEGRRFKGDIWLQGEIDLTRYEEDS